MKHNGRLLELLVVLSLGLGARTGSTQSTLFNIPTTDVVARGKVYYEFDYLGQMPKFEDLPDGSPVHRLHVLVSRFVVGVGGNGEVGANLATLHLGDTNNVFVQPDVKWKFFSSDQGVAAAAGAILYAPINHRDVVDTFALAYASLSKKVDHVYGPRFHVGPYGILGTDNALGVGGPRAGVLAGYEQPFHPRVSFVADWLSGKNGFGYLTPGLSFSLPANGVFNAGYSIGNDSWKDGNATHNRLLFLYYGVTF